MERNESLAGTPATLAQPITGWWTTHSDLRKVAVVFAASFTFTFAFLVRRSHVALRVQLGPRTVRAASIDMPPKQNDLIAAAAVPEKTEAHALKQRRERVETHRSERKVAARHAVFLQAPTASEEIQRKEREIAVGQNLNPRPSALEREFQGSTPAPSNTFSGQEKAPALDFADEAHWQLIASTERNSVENYLNEFPSRERRVTTRPPQDNASASRDAKAAVAALTKYSNAWNAKDLANITAMRPGLDRRSVKAELSSTRSIEMSIRPTSGPKIQGDRATIDCMQQVSQIFRDGIEKQSPGVQVTYVLVRRGGNWLIEASR
ncbi:MAG: hypothetical protein JOY62_06405 [Acidobacteriaceae bacterium]|nr:hypothetical protein [Acidobacteriaceae bacterium]MBV9779589.1 hypothetical protein [Acidobacteriaceae bacterium]